MRAMGTSRLEWGFGGVLLGLASAGISACGSAATKDTLFEEPRASDDATGGGSSPAAGSGAFGEPGAAIPDEGCTAAAKLVYVLDGERGLHSFDPRSLTFTRIGTLDCDAGDEANGTPATTNSMAVDRTGTAWVNYSNGRLFKVSTKDAHCTSTDFDPEAVDDFDFGIRKMGMGFVSNAPGSKEETLFVAPFSSGVQDTSMGLGRMSTQPIEFAKIGRFTEGLKTVPAELTGTGDGKLYGFFTTSPARLAEIDTATGATPAEGQMELESVDTGRAWAFSFWGGDFWFYTSKADPATPNRTSDVTRYKKSGDGSIEVVMKDIGFNIVGAGVSTCAPLVPPK